MRPTPASISMRCARCRRGSTPSPGPDLGILIITHYQRILNYVKPHYVHVLAEGRVVRSGGPELAAEIENRGYDWLLAPTA